MHQQQKHRPGPLHQTNKAHKGTKQGRKTSANPGIKNKPIFKQNVKLTKRERLNQSARVRKLRNEKRINEKRKLGYDGQPPILVGLLGINLTSFLDKVKEQFEVRQYNCRSRYIICETLKLRFNLVLIDYDCFNESIDLIKAVDILMLVHDVDAILHNNYTIANLLRAFNIHCMPTYVHVINALQSSEVSYPPGTLNRTRQQLKTAIGDEKIQVLSKDQDLAQIFHIIGSCKRLHSRFKESRPLIVPDRFEEIDGCLALLGFVRNRTLSPNSLVHLPGYDDYQILHIELLSDPTSIRPGSAKSEAGTKLWPSVMKQESLEQENEIDGMEAEQTWPTADELAQAAERRNTRKVIKKLPPGTSEYQGAWINESEDEDDSESEGGDSIDCASLAEDDDEDMEPDNAEDEGTGDLANDENEMNIESYDVIQSNEKELKLLEKIREARENEAFPDEIDTPVDIPARVRFARYRGLKSFRTSHWDPQENLPPDYSRIFQFQNFKRTKKRVLDGNDNDQGGALPGQYVRIVLKDVQPADIEKINYRWLPPIVVGLLPFERKMTVMNLLIKRVSDSVSPTPIKSKDELVFYVGFRKFRVRPLLTAHSMSTKFKYERYFRDDCAMVATMYAPITFPPAPVLVFRENVEGKRELVASGSVLDSNPNRLIVKRIRLSGHPYKIFSKTSIIRFMFFNSEDVMYFKPVELITKYNRRGHIIEPLGTHGHMKCTFDKKIRSDDCIFMNLYKRVFPKWDYKPVTELRCALRD